jgi:hypothetical protein
MNLLNLPSGLIDWEPGFAASALAGLVLSWLEVNKNGTQLIL